MSKKWEHNISPYDSTMSTVEYRIPKGITVNSMMYNGQSLTTSFGAVIPNCHIFDYYDEDQGCTVLLYEKEALDKILNKNKEGK